MKKISPNLLGFIIALFVTIISLWIYFNYIQKKNYQLIDNPTQQTLQVQIGDNQYIVAPGQQLQISLPTGQYNIQTQTLNDTLSYPQTSFEVTKQRGLINPTLATYYIYGMPYGPRVNKDSIFENLKTTFKGKTYSGDLQIDSAVYTENFYYNMNENFPGLTIKSENEALRKKIFRENDFKQFYFKNYE
ncbi:MAG: hypothetical protein Q4G27_01385 [Flavobacteriaceae bacterium]|nr:hypothetical protein [Flavobacteriaceae bacterium]